MFLVVCDQLTVMWWRHQVIFVSSQWPVMGSFDVFFGVRLKKRLNSVGVGDLRRHSAHCDDWIGSAFLG